MIIMNLELDNFYGFEDFKINFSYPKKIVNSTIKGEFLAEKPNFRYKKVNILMGSNASGKTSIGKAIMEIFNFFYNNSPTGLYEVIRDKERDASFSIDFLVDSEKLYRVNCRLNKGTVLNLDVFYSNILKTDSYEKCISKFNEVKLNMGGNILNKLDALPYFGWLFNLTDEKFKINRYNDNAMDLRILKVILKALDSSIYDVEKSEELEDGFIVRSKNGDLFIQNGEVVDKNILSSGTKNGIEIAHTISSMVKNTHGFYYFDEKFSFINTDIEQAILSLMISILPSYSQLFFTTHNLDLLEMDLPVHTFTFLRKCSTIEVVYSSTITKKNDGSLINKVRNDVFNIAPDTSNIFNLENILLNE